MVRFVNRIEIEIKLNRDRAWLLEHLSQMDDEELYAPRTFSEHDDQSQWSYADHFIHTTLIEQNWNEMFRRHLGGDRGMAKRVNDDGTPQTMEQIMASVHSWTEEWKAEHQGKSLDELVRIGLATRAGDARLPRHAVRRGPRIEDPRRAVGRRHGRSDHGRQRRPRADALAVGFRGSGPRPRMSWLAGLR